MKTYFVRRFFIVLCLMATSIITMAQATRTWVSGVGDDVNPCSRTAPCKTLAGAISKTAAGGEINILDPGGYGAVTITKSIIIDGGGIIGSILSSGTNGIHVIAVKKLTVENCVLSNFSDKGIDINSATAADIMISNVTIHNAGDGISMGGGGGFMVMDGNHIQGNRNAGINISNGQATVSNSVISGCNTGVDAKTGSAIHLSGNIITNNSTALQGPGKISSGGNNTVTGNKAQGVTATVIKLQ